MKTSKFQREMMDKTIKQKNTVKVFTRCGDAPIIEKEGCDILVSYGDYWVDFQGGQTIVSKKEGALLNTKPYPACGKPLISPDEFFDAVGKIKAEIDRFMPVILDDFKLNELPNLDLKDSRLIDAAIEYLKEAREKMVDAKVEIEQDEKTMKNIKEQILFFMGGDKTIKNADGRG